MARLRSFLAGSAFGVLAVGLLASGIPDGHAEETRKDVRLLVSCDEGTRARVLEALRPLEVVVYDLATMERVPAAARASLVDALAVWKSVDRAVAETRAAGPKDATLSVLRIAITSNEVSLSVRVNDLVLLDALQERLRKSAAMEVSGLERAQAVRREASGPFESSIRFVATPAEARSAPGAAAVSVASFPLVPVRDAIQGRGAELRRVSAERRAVGTDGKVTSTHTWDCEVPDAGSLMTLSESLGALPGVRVTAMSWRLTSGGRVHALIDVTAYLE